MSIKIQILIVVEQIQVNSQYFEIKVKKVKIYVQVRSLLVKSCTQNFFVTYGAQYFRTVEQDAINLLVFKFLFSRFIIKRTDYNSSVACRRNWAEQNSHWWIH